MEALMEFRAFLLREEKAEATVKKYMHEAECFQRFLEGRQPDKELLLEYRKLLTEKYQARTVNGKLAAIHAWLKFLGHGEDKIKLLRVQKRAFIEENRELTQKEYERLLETAKKQGKQQLYHLMLVIGSTGIRVSELPFITVEALKKGKAEISLKGKCRVILFPRHVVATLKQYCKAREIEKGCIFRTRSGRPLDRSNICHAMKRLCREARVAASKVFPHNLRHLFARSFYLATQDLSHLADILGHSSIETTRIYVAATAGELEKVLNQMAAGITKKIPRNHYSVVSNPSIRY